MDALLKVPFMYIYIIITLQLHGDLTDNFNLQRLRHNFQVCSASPLKKRKASGSINEIVDIAHAVKKSGIMKALEKYYMQLETNKEILMTNA